MTYPLWYKLLYYWVNIEYRSGLTLPYIIGAIKYENKLEVSDLTIVTFIEELVINELPCCTIIKYCTNIHEIVLGLKDINEVEKFSMGKRLKDKFYIAESVIDKFKTEKEMKNYCSIQYSRAIANNNFSWSGREWQSLGSSDYSLFDKASSLIIQ